MVDFVKLAGVATRLITANGRTISLVKPAEDQVQPWENPVGSATETPAFGAFVPPNTVRQFGLTALGTGSEFRDLIQQSEQIIIVTPQEDVDYGSFTNVLDEGVQWGIIGSQTLRPGTVTLLGFLGVRR